MNIQGGMLNEILHLYLDKCARIGSIASTIGNTVSWTKGEHYRGGSQEAKEATCLKLKSALLSESINSIIYRERRNILLRCTAGRNREENTWTTSTLDSASWSSRRTDQLHAIMPRNDTRVYYLLAISVQFTHRNSTYIWPQKSLVDILKSWEIPLQFTLDCGVCSLSVKGYNSCIVNEICMIWMKGFHICFHSESTFDRLNMLHLLMSLKMDNHLAGFPGCEW